MAFWELTSYVSNDFFPNPKTPPQLAARDATLRQTSLLSEQFENTLAERTKQMTEDKATLEAERESLQRRLEKVGAGNSAEACN